MNLQVIAILSSVKRQQWRKPKKKYVSLLTGISKMAYVIVFKFGKQSPLVGGHLHSKFR